MRKQLTFLFAFLFLVAIKVQAQTYANTAINTTDGRVTTTYEIQGSTLYYHVHVVLPDTLIAEINNGYDQENQAQFWLYMPDNVVKGFEFCFTTNAYFPTSDSNVTHTSEGNVHDFVGTIDLSNLTSQDLAETYYQTGLCIIEVGDPYYYNDQQESSML